MDSALPTLEQAAASVRRAMIGELPKCIRAVSVAITPTGVWLSVYHDGALQPDIQEMFEMAITEVYADFPGLGEPGPHVRAAFEQCDEPARLPALGRLVYSRTGTKFRLPGDVRL